MTGIAMQGMSDIMALYSGGASSLCVNGSVDMLGRKTGLAGTVYHEYALFEDAPQKGEFDKDGFLRNLAIGLAVFAVCAIGAAVSIVTFGAGSVLAGAFIGASIGALSTTAIKAGEELSTGNVRSFSEAARDVVISAAAGGFTGACLIAFPATAFFSPEIYAGVSLTGRASWALGDWSMSNEEKMAYIFDTKQMAVDFSIGSLIGMLVPGMVARKAARDAERNIKKYTCKSGSNTNKLFKNQSLLDEHYGKHGQEIADVLGDSNYSIDKYLDDANYIINNGTYVPELNGYVSFMSGKKYGFVGLDRTTGDITTFHIKNISELIKKAPSLGFER